MHPILATSWLDPIVDGMYWLVTTINIPIHNLGVSLIVLAVLLRLIFWPLNVKQFKSMIAMQKVAPQVKKLQEKYKSDPQKLQAETMALYKQAGANPLSGCLPMLIQYPFLIAVLYVVLNHKNVFEDQHFLWIGTAISQNAPVIFGVPLFASSLAHADLVFLLLYIASMYVTVRYGSMPATDPQQAQTQKIMSIMSPLMLGFFGFKWGWPSALVVYWFTSNLLQMAQQFYLLRKYHEPLAFADSTHMISDVPPPADVADAQPTKSLPKSGNGPAKTYKVKKKTKGANS